MAKKKRRARGQVIQRAPTKPESWTLYAYASGKQHSRTVYAPNRTEADKLLTKWLSELDAGNYAPPSKETLGEYLLRWLDEHARPNTARKTRKGYTTNVVKHINPRLGGTPLHKLRGAQVQSMYVDLLAHLSPRSVEYVHTTLRAALNHAVDMELIPRNPCDKVKPPKVQKRPPEVLTPAEVETVLAALEESPLCVPVALAVVTGMRRGELLGLTWQDVNLDAATVTIRRAQEEARQGAPVYTTAKTVLSARLSPLVPPCVPSSPPIVPDRTSCAACLVVSTQNTG